jgi:hypothetical protein
MSLLKLLVITVFIGLTFEQVAKPCGNGTVSKTACLSAAVPRGNYCCYLDYTKTPTNSTEGQMCITLEFNDTLNNIDEDYLTTLGYGVKDLVCPNETEYVPNNCGAVGITVPQSKEGCTRAKIPEQHCCYLTYKTTDGTVQSSACRRFAELKKSGEDYDITEDDDVTADLAQFSTDSSSYTALSIECSHLFIKLSLLNIFVIMISLL